ncbi:hypothetical protein KB553_00260 [Chryseobacterium rhizoplanae]|uniref:hypothetical protein n=1 Tax=Chryseobacterium rhizoplanae TaxID=1609531 RepID=UPI001CE2BE10|nr:hypothetical protein [Chryseobacterium rhizoplanae]UCA59977.1 hypothetical protein KB553_00260 [Chryseobacterium rhizoplanae]
MFKIFVIGSGLREEYTVFKIPIYVLYFLILPLLVVTFVCIFKESKKMFTYLNISLFLMIIFHAIIFCVKYQRTTNHTTYLFLYLVSNVLFVVGPVILINYFKHHPGKSEIEEIGTHSD